MGYMRRRLDNFVRGLLGLPDPCMIPDEYLGREKYLAIRMKRHNLIYSDVVATGKTISEVMKNAKDNGYKQGKFCIMRSPISGGVILATA